MLQNIRDKTQGWFTTALISVICVTFVFWGVHSFVGGNNASPDMVAKVDGVIISQSQLKTTYNRLKEQQQMQLGAGFAMTDSVQNKLRQSALEQLISSQALSAAALEEGLRFTPSQVGQVISGISAFQDQGHFSPARFVQAIASLGFTEQGFYDDVRNAMLINQLRVGLIGSSFALPTEITRALPLINQKRDIQYVIFNAKDYLNQVLVSPSEIQLYYQKHQDQYKTQATVVLQYITLNLSDLVAKQSITVSEAKDYYDSHADNYTMPAKWQLQTVFLAANANAGHSPLKTMQSVVDAMQNGKSLAQVNSVDSALQVQDSYWLNDKELDPAIKAVVSHLNVNQVSAPIQTAQGWVVVKLIGQQKAQVQSFDQIKSQVIQSLAQQKALQTYADISDQLSQATYTHPDNLTDAAKQLSLPIKTTAELSVASPEKDLWANEAVRTAAFSSDVLAGNNSSLITLSDSQAVVIRMLKYKAAAVQSLPQVQASILTLLKQQKSAALAQAQAAQWLSLATTAKNPSATIQGHAWTKANGVGRYSASLNNAIVNAAFQLSRPNNTVSAGVFTLTPQSVSVVQLLNITNVGSSEMNPIQQRVLEQQIASGYAQLDYQLYVQGVMSKANIKVTAPSHE